MPTVAMNEFACRQTADSGYSHYAGSFAELCALVEANIDSRVALDPAGQVVKVTLPGEGFFSAVVQVTPETRLVGHYDSRTPEEAPYLSFRALGGDKVPAAETDVILYSREKLAEKNENSTDADWEIVSINAKRTTEPEPPHPVTMMRNQLNLAGGTAVSYTPEQWAESVAYWLGGDGNAPFVLLEQ